MANKGKKAAILTKPGVSGNAVRKVQTQDAIRSLLAECNLRSVKGRKDAFLKLYIPFLGSISQICRALTISRQTFYDWCEADPEFTANVQEQAEAMIDKYEYVVNKDALVNENVDSAKWVLERKGKKRGYSTRQEITGADGESIVQVQTMTPAQQMREFVDSLRALGIRNTDSVDTLFTKLGIRAKL